MRAEEGQKRRLMKQAFEARRRFRARHRTYRGETSPLKHVGVPEGLYEKCKRCRERFVKDDILENKMVCPSCDSHFRLRAIDRLNMTVDEGTFIEKGLGYISLNPLFQEDYEQKLAENRERTGADEAFIYGYGEIKGIPCVLGVLDSHFMMGSMGSVVGEKVVKSVEYALVRRLPLVLFIASGGARMQEGIYSLMQMAKTAGAIQKLNQQDLLYISILTHPTTGGVSASFASLGDIILAEPEALIGFAGPRVIKQTIKQELPEGFQSAEFLLEKGMLDKIVHRHAMKDTLYRLLYLHEKGARL